MNILFLTLATIGTKGVRHCSNGHPDAHYYIAQYIVVTCLSITTVYSIVVNWRDDIIQP
jgi:hypothetical protein